MSTTRLSPRETEMVKLVGQGMANKEVASVMGIAEGSVKIMMSRIFIKLGLKSRLAVSLWWLKECGDLQPKPVNQCGERLKEIRSRTERAVPGTEGPDGNHAWYAGTLPEEVGGHEMWPIYRNGPESAETVGYCCERADTEFVASSRNDIPYLLSLIREMRLEIETLRRERSDYRERDISDDMESKTLSERVYLLTSNRIADITRR